jgi:hypothetical protein
LYFLCLSSRRVLLYILTDLQARYLISPVPPLITDPSEIQSLSASLLARNVAAHTRARRGYNRVGHSTLTSKADRAQLRALLETRRDDLAVRAMMWRTSKYAKTENKLEMENESSDITMEIESD